MKNALSFYNGYSFWQKIHTCIRFSTCPFEELLRYVPEEGIILDVGCGYGIFSNMMALETAKRRVVGIDTDPDKVAVAKKTIGDRNNIEFHSCRIESLDYAHYSAVTIIDCLYLMLPEDQEELLLKCSEKLNGNGMLLCKVMDTRNAIKQALEYFQETVSVKILRLTKGAGLFYLPPEKYVRWLRSAGLKTRLIPMDRGYPHPHLAIVGAK